MTVDSRPLLHVVGEVTDDVAQRLVLLEREVAGLRQAFESRAPIEQAKGMLMMRYGMCESRAFALLVRWSSHHNVKLRVVAATLVKIAVEDYESVSHDFGTERLLHQVLSGTPRPP